jgi:DNA-binding transcriptional MerR regulator
MDSGATGLHKLYYRIGEVAEIIGVEPHVLRFWETEFRSIRPQKSRKGQRIYSRRDVEKLMRVKDLLYVQGFTIAGARRRLREAGAEPEPVAAAETAGVRSAIEAGVVAAAERARALERVAQHERSVATLRSALLEVRGEVEAALNDLDGGDDAQ